MLSLNALDILVTDSNCLCVFQFETVDISAVIVITSNLVFSVYSQCILSGRFSIVMNIVGGFPVHIILITS